MKVSLQLLIFIVFSQQILVGCRFKMTRAFCESRNTTLAKVNLCQLKLVNRDVSNFNLNVTLFDKYDQVHLNLYLMKKLTGGYKPHLYNVTVDVCEFLKKRNNPLVNIIYGLFKDYSNLNHTCPFYGDQILKDFSLSLAVLKNLPVSNGEYILMLTWIFKDVPLVVTNIYWEYYFTMNY